MVPKEVFHYTKASVALQEILYKKQLRIRQLKYMNDPRESKEHFFDFYISPPNDEGDITELHIRLSQTATQIKLNEWKVLCFSKDHPDLESDNMLKWHNPFLRGSHRPTMWAHYAENHKGVCLTFDGKKLDTQIKRALSDIKCEIFPEGDVNYEDFADPASEAINTDEVLRLNDIELEKWLREYFRKNYKAIFLKKYRDWQDENEYRWVIHSGDGSPEFFIPIGDTVKEITVGCDFHETYHPSLFKFCKDLGVSAYRMTWYNGVPDRRKIFPPK